jgi:hypothetical protein
MDGELHKRIINAVAAAAAPIAKSVDALAAQLVDDRRAASESRGKLYDRMGAVERTMEGVSVHVETTARDVAELKGQLGGFEPRLRAMESFRNGVTGEHRGAGKVLERLRSTATLGLALASAIAAWWAVWRGVK